MKEELSVKLDKCRLILCEMCSYKIYPISAVTSTKFYYFILCVIFLIRVITSYEQLNCDVLDKERLHSNEKKLTIAMHKDKSHNHNIE